MSNQPKDRTFNSAEMATNKLRARDAVLTSLMWFIYAYLWLPLISLGAWIIGIDFAYDSLIAAGGLSGLSKFCVGTGLPHLLLPCS